ncbi:hypothetical protein BH09ACT1_BH09ACT1_15410 [soil metagenome]
MSTFDQFANQGGAAAGDDAEVAEAQREADELLKQSASAADAADFGGGPLGSAPDEPTPADEPTSADDAGEDDTPAANI